MISARADRKAIRRQRQATHAREKASARVRRHEDRDHIYRNVCGDFPANGPVVVEAVKKASSFGGQLDAVESLHDAISASGEHDPEQWFGGMAALTFFAGPPLSLVVWMATEHDYSIPISVGIVWVIATVLFLFMQRMPYRRLRRAVRQANSRRPLHPVELEYLERRTKELERGPSTESWY